MVSTKALWLGVCWGKFSLVMFSRATLTLAPRYRELEYPTGHIYDRILITNKEKLSINVWYIGHTNIWTLHISLRSPFLESKFY